MEEIIRNLLKAGCEVASETDGDVHCFYCGAYIQVGEEHNEDCAFVVGKEYLERNKTKLQLMAKIIEEADEAKQKLREKGYGWVGLGLSETVDQVPECKE